MNRRSPAPWAVADGPAYGVGGVPVTVVVDAREQPVANFGSGEVGMRNAELGAAAPMLLDTLRAAYAEVGDVDLEYASQWVRDARLLLHFLEEGP